MNHVEPPRALAARAARGTAYLVVGQLATQGLRLGSNLILTRLLLPEAFGLMAVVQAVTTGLHLISDVGIWTSIVRSPRGHDKAFQDTAWTVSLVRGIGLFLVGCAVAWPASLFYGRPELLWLLPIVTLQAVVVGAESTKSAIANRNVEVGRIITMEVSSQVVGLCVSVPVAFATRSVFALVAASLASALTRTLMSHVFMPGPLNSLRWEREALHEIFTFGGWIFVSTLLFFGGTRWDVFALGRIEGMGFLGVYGLAQMIAAVSSGISDRIMGFVLLPALSERVRTAPGEFGRDVRSARLILLPAGAVLFLGAAMTAPAFFHFFYLKVYDDAGWMVQLLVLVSWSSLLQESSARALMAVGDSRSMAIGNMVRVLVTIAATSFGFELGSIVGFILGSALGGFAGTAYVDWALRRHGVKTLLFDLVATLLFVAVGTASCGIPRLLAGVVGVGAATLTLVPLLLVLAPLAALVGVRTRAAVRGMR